jgi:hypothetical protein
VEVLAVGRPRHDVEQADDIVVHAQVAQQLDLAQDARRVLQGASARL